MTRLNVAINVILVTVFSTGSAAAALAIRSADIVDGQVMTVDLAKAAVTRKKIAANAVTGATLEESTLGIVPNADQLDGRDSMSFVSGGARIVSGRTSIARGATATIFTSTVANEIGFNIAYRCPGGSPSVSGQIEFRNKSASAWEVWYQDGGDDPNYVESLAGTTTTFAANEQWHSIKFSLAKMSASGRATVIFSVNDALTTCKANGLATISS
jgi:hypothetical protein